MKLTTELLNVALRPVSDILRGKSTTGAPQYLKMEANKNRLHLSANDGQQSAETEVECEGDLKPMCIPFASLQNILPLFGENVSMDASEKTLRIRSKGSYTLNTVDTKEFLEIKNDKMNKLGVNCVDLADCIDRVKFASRKEDSRANLFGVNVRLSAKKIVAEAATGLIFSKMEKASIAADAQFLIPYPFVSNVVNNLRNAGAVLSVSENRISVAFDAGCYACSLYGIKFPDSYMNLDASKGASIGEFKPAEWLPIFRSIYSMAGEEGKLRCDVRIDAGKLKYEGPQGVVDVKIDKLSKPLHLNASTFIACLEAFEDNPCKATVSKDQALILSYQDLTVATTQLRS